MPPAGGRAPALRGWVRHASGNSGAHRRRTHPAWTRLCADRRPARQCQRHDRPGGDPKRLGRRHPLLRHLAVLRPWQERASPRRIPARPPARAVRDLHQGGPRAAPHHSARSSGPGVLARSAAVHAALRLQLRRHHAFLRGQPAAARPRIGRPAGDPRPRPVVPSLRAAGGGADAGTGHQRLARVGPAPLRRRHLGGGRRHQRRRPDSALPGSGRTGLFPGRPGLQSARPRRARPRLSPLRRRWRGHHRWRPVRLRHPCHRRSGRRLLPLRRSTPRSDAARPGDGRRMQPARRRPGHRRPECSFPSPTRWSPPPSPAPPAPNTSPATSGACKPTSPPTCGSS